MIPCLIQLWRARNKSTWSLLNSLHNDLIFLQKTDGYLNFFLLVLFFLENSAERLLLYVSYSIICLDLRTQTKQNRVVSFEYYGKDCFIKVIVFLIRDLLNGSINHLIYTS